MKAAVLTNSRDIEVQERKRPSLEADDVLVRVAACGVCTVV